MSREVKIICEMEIEERKKGNKCPQSRHCLQGFTIQQQYADKQLMINGL